MTSNTDQPKSNPAINKALPFLRQAARELDGVLRDEVMMTEVR